MDKWAITEKWQFFLYFYTLYQKKEKEIILTTIYQKGKDL